MPRKAIKPSVTLCLVNLMNALTDERRNLYVKVLDAEAAVETADKADDTAAHRAELAAYEATARYEKINDIIQAVYEIDRDYSRLNASSLKYRNAEPF